MTISSKSKSSDLVDAYIEKFPREFQIRMQQIRSIIRSAAPLAEESISYKMPAYKYKGVLVYFAGFKNHIGFYATPTGNAQFKNALGEYKTGRGSIQFPMDAPLPTLLIEKMVKFKVKENESKAIWAKKPK